MTEVKRSETFPVRGTWTAIVTPFGDAPDHAVDFDELSRLVEAQIAGGVDVIVPCGTTGESPTLSHDEHDAVVGHVVRVVAGRVPVVAGTGSNSTREALRLTSRAAEAGADGALVVCPYYNRPTQRMLVEHFARVADASQIPVVLYNVPGRTGVNLEAESVARIAERCANVVGLKEAASSLAQVSRTRDLTDLPILSGSDELTLAMMAVGASGVISVASNVLPAEVCAMVSAALNGDFASARRAHARLFALFEGLFVEPNPAPVKCALKILGRGTGEVRPPLLPVLPETEARLRTLLDALA